MHKTSLSIAFALLTGCTGSIGTMACDGDETKVDGTCVRANDESPVEAVRETEITDGGEGQADAGETEAQDAGAAREDKPDAEVVAACKPAAEPDLPDPLFQDTNCDGIDGDIATSIFISSGGDDAATGSLAAPVKSLARGLALASERKVSTVLVAEGVYLESLRLVSGVSIYGGYAQGTWQRDTKNATVIQAPSPAVQGVDIEKPTLLSALRISSEDAAQGSSSIAIQLTRATAVTLEDLDVQAGAGGDAFVVLGALANGAKGQDGKSGDDGYRAYAAGCDGLRPAPVVGAGGSATICRGGVFSGRGGSGGMGGNYHVRYSETYTAASTGGTGGVPSADASGIIASSGGRIGKDGADAARGSVGQAGARGANGAAGMSIGTFSEAGYTPSRGGSGKNGQAGGGGAGGGGLEGCFDGSACGWVVGATGGGGGSGGCGGEAGAGGFGGGASIALLLWQSSPTLRRVFLTAGDGGLGGDGTAGTEGGPGGEGGWYAEGFGCAQQGLADSGRGGAGGAGGHGGDGAGGGGGPSIGIVFAGGSAPSANTEFATPMAGKAGAGGYGGGTGLTGELGYSGSTFTGP